MKNNFFPYDLEVQPFWGEDWEYRKLVKPFVYKMSDMSRSITVPAGFITDFASVPRPFWAVLPPWGNYGPAAVVHDFLYSVERQKYVPDPDEPDNTVKITRKIADRIFLRAMKDCGVNVFRRRIIYSAVRAFGWTGYEEKGR